MKKKIVSLVLACCLLVNPVTAFAEKNVDETAADETAVEENADDDTGTGGGRRAER